MRAFSVIPWVIPWAPQRAFPEGRMKNGLVVKITVRVGAAQEGITEETLFECQFQRLSAVRWIPPRDAFNERSSFFGNSLIVELVV